MSRLANQPKTFVRTTIGDVAQRCGLSKTTVSKVMNVPAAELDVPEATRQRVLEACRELSYQPNWRARALRRGQTHTIGFVHHQSMPMFSELWHRMVSRLGEVLRQGGFEMQLVPAPPHNCEWDQMFLEQRFDACVVFHELTDTLAKSLEMARIPVVLVNAKHGAYPSVVPDDHQGGKAATQHLIAAGHRRITFLTCPSITPHFSIDARIEGYRDAMNQAGLGQFISVLNQDPMSAMKALQRLTEKPTAIVAYNDRVAVPLLHACWTVGVRVPDDLAVATFNDVLMTRHSIPPLTTIDFSTETMADRAAAMLLERINQRSKDSDSNAWTSANDHVVLPAMLIPRESTRASSRLA